MLRPMLVILAGRALGQVGQAHHVAAAAVEMIHMATLVHDDVLDEADQRRRGMTVNRLHGNEAAVLLGDLLVSHAFCLTSSAQLPWLNRWLSSTATTLCEGELMQLYYRDVHELDETRYLEIIQKKTAVLMGTSGYIGARLAGASESESSGMEVFGNNLGVAFQIMDDVLDLVGSEESTGKTLGLDLEKGKVTLPGLHFVQEAPPGRRAERLAMLRAGARRKREELASVLRETGSIEYARQRARDYVDRAVAALPRHGDAAVRDMLERVARAVVS